MTISLYDLSEKNLTRCERWHGPSGISSWSLSDWACAMVGEAGEACNLIKKYNRLRDGLRNLNTRDSDAHSLLPRIGEELADTVIYAELLAQACNRDLTQEIIQKFNSVSDLYNFPERL